MRRRLTFIVASVAAIAVLVVGGTAVASATRGDDDSDEQPLTGATADKVKSAGLKEAGGGTVVEMERDVEGARTYKVEVKKPSGSTVEVNLNSSFEVVAEPEDSANENAQDEKNEADDQDDQNDKNENEQADHDD